jgi:glycosyltransferase involved in cell wall biosynthesis
VFGGVLPSDFRAADFLPSVVTGKARDYFLASGHAWGDWTPEAVVILGDFGGVRLMVESVEAYHPGTFSVIPAYHYVPIEGIDLPPRWGELWRTVRPVAVTEFAADEIAKIMGYRPPVVYHGVSEDFWPVSPQRPIILNMPKDDSRRVIDTREKARQFLGINPRAKVILRTDRNMPRKNFPAMIRALVPILMERDDTIVLLHCRVWDQGGHLQDTISKFPQRVGDRILISDTGGEVPREVLNIMYNGASVYVGSGPEGFGLCYAESIACGTPAIGLQYSSLPEVIGPAGMVVPVDTLTDNEYDHLWARPQEDRLTASIRWLLDHPSRAQAIGALGPRHVRSRFSWTQAAERFGVILRGGTPEPYAAVPSAGETA